ncbi:hypothetical protein F7U70_000780 [Vibrio fluvialis]|nr:hypothetical protein [Vibrio fluvialis]
MWFDRLSQKKLPDLPPTIEPCRYQWLGKNDECLNRHAEIHYENLLVDDGYVRCQLNSGNYSFIQADKGLKPSIDLFNNAITTISKQMESNTDRLVSPMLPAAIVNSESHLLPVEVVLVEVLNKGHLHHISQRPRLDIRYDEEVTDAARAKRLSKGALVHLASHSECWQRQTLSGVVPKKVLARFSDDEYNTYENCVFARLLDKFEYHLQRRLSTLTTLLLTIDQAMKFYQSQNIDFRLSKNVCELWGRTFDEETTAQASELLSGTIDKLQHLNHSVQSLKQTGLYSRIDRNKQLSGALHRTNILSHDPHYRHLAILWEQLEVTISRTKNSPDEQFWLNQELSYSYSQYVGLVLTHALHPYLNGRSEGEWAGRKLRLQRCGFEWQLVLVRDGVSRSNDILLTVVPWFSHVPLAENCQHLSKNHVIAWPNIGNQNHQDMNADKFITITPSDMYCVERLGLIVDRVLYKDILMSYGTPIVKVPTKPLEFAQKITSISVDSHTHSLRLFGEINQKESKQLKDLLVQSNAREQITALEIRQKEIESLIVCPICSSKTDFVSQPSGFKQTCSCGFTRYLKDSNDGNFNFEQFYKSSDFLLTGRRSFSVDFDK